MSAPSLVRRAHNNHRSSSSPPPFDTSASTRRDADDHHHSNHVDLQNTRASIARRSIFSSWNLFFIKSKKTWTTIKGWLTLCIAFFMLNLIFMGKISTTSPSFRRAHSSSSSSSSTLVPTYSYYTFHSDHNSLRYHIQIPHSILLFNSSLDPRPISQASSSSLVLPTHRIRSKNKAAYFGHLEIEMLPKSTSSRFQRFQRSIHNETEEDAIAKAAAIYDDMDDRIAVFMTGWDDSSDAQRLPVVLSSEKKHQSSTGIIKDAQQEKDCRRVSWHKTVYPNCNTFHEFDLSKVLLDETTAYVGGGSYRHVYLAETQPVPVVIKVTGLDDSYIGIRSVGEFLMDGVVGAAVSKNPYLTEMYGFCSLSMFSEVVWGGSIDDFVMPRGRCSKTVERMLNRTRTGPVESMNNLTATQKLVWAYMMTQGVAALHQHPEGSIVHSDIALRQFLVTDDGKQLKLTDFNQAQILRYDTNTNQTCDYISMHDYGSHRAPEVYMRKPVQAQIDIWGLGGCFYSLLTGLRTYYDQCEANAVPKRVIKGAQYKIDDRWRNHSYAESVLVHAIEECSIYDPAKRITLESLLELLGNAVKENQRRKEKQRPNVAAGTAAIDTK